MLAKFLGLFGFDLNRQIQLLKERVEDFTREKTDQIKGEVKEIGLMVALAAAGGIMALMTFIIFLMAIYRWVATTAGPFTGDVVVGGITAVLALIFLVLASSRGKSKLKVHDRTERIIPEEEEEGCLLFSAATHSRKPFNAGDRNSLSFWRSPSPIVRRSERVFFQCAPDRDRHRFGNKPSDS